MDPKELSAILTKECNLKGSKPLLVGVSGGADSLCLLSLLSALNLSIVAAYFDHRLRPESAQDGLSVAKVAASLNCGFVSASGDVRGMAERERLSVEAAARKARYTFLFEQAREIGAEAVAVGHTADDQVETILLHLLRGSGLDGLKGMSYRSLLPGFSTEIPLIRPLLGFWRSETAGYCAEHGLQPLEDRTNQDKRYLRNRLRLELIPQLESYNPGVKWHLWTLGQIAQASLSGTDEITDWVYRRCLIAESSGEYAALSSRELAELSDGWVTNMIRAAVERVRADPANLDFRALQRALRLIRRPEPAGQVDLTSNLALIKVHGRVYIADRRFTLPTSEWPQVTPAERIELNLPCQTFLSEAWRLRADIRAIQPGETVPDDPLEAWLDMERLEQPLQVRAWRSGDRFQPFGMQGTMKVADFFINLKIPRIARARWPLVIAGEEVIWVAGLRVSEKYRLTQNSRKAIHLVLERS
jgi:tRNA(Ile)-lysidine synthase